MKKPVKISQAFFIFILLQNNLLWKFPGFLHAGFLIFLRDNIAPSLKVIYDFSHNLQSRPERSELTEGKICTKS